MSHSADSPKRRPSLPPIRPAEPQAQPPRKPPVQPNRSSDHVPPTKIANRIGAARHLSELALAPKSESELELDAPTRRAEVPRTAEAHGRRSSERKFRVSERFALGEMLGEGGLGCVVAAKDAALRRNVALKFIKEHDAESVARFIEEAQITAQLQHPNIVPIYDLTQAADGKFLLAMKPVEGETFAEVIRKAHQRTRQRGAGSDDLRRLLETFLKICDAVAYAHSQGVIHRDLKPDNVMVGAFGEVLVMDWGLAKPILSADSDSATTGETAVPAVVPTTMRAKTRRPSGMERASTDRRPQVSSDRREAFGNVTLQGQVQGTIAYMAPEQAHGSLQLDEGVDIFALGGILYTVLTYRWPIEGKTEEDMIATAIENRIIPPRRRAPKAAIPAELEAVAMKAMARRRADRFATVVELRAEIERFLDGRLLHSARYAPWVRLAKWVRRHPTLSVSMGMMAGLATVTALIVVTLMANLRDIDRQREIDSARAAVAEAQRQQEAADRARAEAEADAQKQRARLAESAAAMAEIERDRARELANAQSQAKRDEAIEEFTQEWADSRRRGESMSMFVHRVGTTKLQHYLGAFDRLIDRVAPTTGLVLTSDDFLHRGLLRTMLSHTDSTFLDAALADLNRALELDPNSVRAMMYRGLARSHKHDWNGALADYNRALAFAPDDPGVLQSRGWVKVQLGDRPGALADFDRSIARNPHSADAYNNRATLRSQMRDFAGAIADYDRALDLVPNAPLTYNNRGVAKLQANDFDGAMADFEACLALLPHFADGYDNRGMVKFQRGQIDDALADFERAANLNPQLASAHVNCAQVYFSRDDFSRAIDSCTRALAVNPNDLSARLIRGMAHFSQRQFVEALADVDRVLQAETHVWQAWHTRGLALLALNRPVEGRQALQAAYRYCAYPNSRHQIAEQIRRAGGTPPTD